MISAPRNICGNKMVWIVESDLSMTESLKLKRRRTQIMTTSPAYYLRSATKCVAALTPLFLRHLNTGTLAIFLFVALAFLTRIRDVETKGSIPVRAKKEIAIANFSFSPKMFTVPAGGTVTWANQHKVPPVISSAENQFHKSALLQPRQSLSNAFATGGTYSYFCSIPRMTENIIAK